MAPCRIASRMRGVTYQLRRLHIRQDIVSRSLPTSLARSITTSTAAKASISTTTTSADGNVPVKPFEEQTVLATIHRFPSLEPLRFETFPANHLNLPTRRDILHRAVVYEGDMTRLGTASTKTRYEVRGSSRKIRPQKGSGRARLGDKKSPMLVGGGVAHGPKPRDFSTGLQKKVYDLAWRTALSYRFRKGELLIVDNAIEIESPSARLLQHIFDMHDRERGRGRSLLVTLEERPLLELALEKLGRERQALLWDEVDVKDLLELSRIIIERDALHNILLSHQEDLTHSSVPPSALIKSSPPRDLEAIPGWSEFRSIAAAPPSDRESLRPDLYASVAASRVARAETLPEGPEKLSLSISAYELVAEAKDLQRSLLPALGPLALEQQQQADKASSLGSTPAGGDATLAAEALAVRIAEIKLQTDTLRAEAAEHRAQALRWQGHEEEADELLAEAGDVRVDVQKREIELCQAKRQEAEQRAQVLVDRNDLEGARAAQLEAKALEEEEERLLAEQNEPIWEEPYYEEEAVEEPLKEDDKSQEKR